MSSPPTSRRNPKPPQATTAPELRLQPPSATPFSETPVAPGMEESSRPLLPSSSAATSRKRKAPGASTVAEASTSSAAGGDAEGAEAQTGAPAEPAVAGPVAKKSRTNTPWSPAEEQRLKNMRDVGSSWSDIAKTFPTRTEGSVKKHWYKDMHYAEFAEDESTALLAAIKEYEANKWKVIGQKVGKPAKACEQYAKEHFGNRI
ncbi:myb-like transcription factor [Lasallia pustulata]|uniref:Tpa: myb-like transcription factor n=1 Tax=Lasallia pustulata TaxID=136370 RepID=A0A1W5CWY5_9LECA|nr:myb-like transcription factor [Lasallia pustulata]